MSISLASLPNEILTSIFQDECLSNLDLTRVQLTCRLFRDSIQQQACQRYTFRVDAPDHSTWRLVRCLLQNPTAAQRFTEIRVEWQRRKAADKDTWTPAWNWTAEELEKIANICETWNISEDTQSCLEQGVNSEALLPFLLVFTLNLKVLDLGDPNTELVAHSYSDWKSGRAYEALGGTPGSHRDQFDEECDSNTPNDSDSLFFYENVPWSRGVEYTNETGLPSQYEANVLPGLASLEHFRIGNPEIRGSSFEAPRSGPIFRLCFLPNIKTIHAFGVSNRYPYEDTDWGRDLCRVETGTSPLKHLVLYTVTNSTYTPLAKGHTLSEAVAKGLTNLVSVEIKDRPDNYKIEKRFDEEYSDDDSINEPAATQAGIWAADEALGRLILQNNKKTLLPTKILINGAGFNEDGQFDQDVAKKRALAAKQALWEQTRGKLERLKLKPSPIESIQPDLLSQITLTLGRKDIFKLMLSSKTFQDARYQSIWLRHELGNITEFEKRLYTGLKSLENIHLMRAPLVNRDPRGQFSDLNMVLDAIKNGTVAGPKKIQLSLYGYKPEIQAPSPSPSPPLQRRRAFRMPTALDDIDIYTSAPAAMGNTSASTPSFRQPPVKATQQRKRSKRSRLWALMDDIESEESESGSESGSDAAGEEVPPASADEITRYSPDKYTDFLSILKAHSEAKSASEEFQLHVSLDCRHGFLLQFCDMTRLTQLQIQGPFSDFRWGKKFNPAKGLVPLINMLSSMPACLKTLVFQRGFNKPEGTPKRLEALWGNLRVLQDVVSNMTSLTSLAVNDGYIYHPSFILLPPESVKRLKYAGEVSASWWRKFASFPFTGVELLTLNCTGLGSEELTYLDSVGEEIYEIPADLRLGSIQMTGLKWIEFHELSLLNQNYPKDLLELILKNNLQISAHSLKIIAQERANRCVGKMVKKFPRIIKEQSKSCKWQLEWAFKQARDQYLFNHVTNQRSLPHDNFTDQEFEAEMEREVGKAIVKWFEDYYAAELVKDFTEALKKNLTK
ncbi:hypothetical protein TWF730_005508 [Orbilia blumenaviensis]|uniref:F-box domain-containing protein n=1 Tax=Orbilia blumenaviensis TaxID=1796055 RepID=A0AAV9VIJ6_9PEZI